MEHLSVVLKVPAAALAIPRKFLFIYEVRTCSNRGPILVEPVLRFWFAVLHKISSQVQVQFEVLSQRGMNRTEPNFGNPRPAVMLISKEKTTSESATHLAVK